MNNICNINKCYAYTYFPCQNFVRMKILKTKAVAKIQSISYSKHFGSEILDLYSMYRYVFYLLFDGVED